ncbi:myogenesis-regulating glycosidase-like isoform X2 [Asterias amurensis]|uniref:myogenesis-regulating glycosidase-like isoform X2 n=1 Tax=Asterias amurensis TaxID=7602 RepID=UPI003AB30CAA
MMDSMDDQLINLDQVFTNGHSESVQPAPPAAASSQVVVDAEGNGTITVEVPNVDHSEVQRKMDSDDGPAKIDIARPIKLLKTPRELKLKICIILLFFLIIAATTCILVLYVEEPLHYKRGSAALYTGSREFVVHVSGANITRGLIGRNLPDMLPFSCDPFDTKNLCLEYMDIARLLIHWEEYTEMDCYTLSWEAFSHDLVHRDCYTLENIHWYGGGVAANQQWPLEKMNQSREPFISGDETSSFGPIVERYWLSSHGVGIRVSNESPLFISVNEESQQLCFESTYIDSPFPNPEKKQPKLEYTLCAAPNMRLVHEKMLDKFGKKVKTVPTEVLEQGPMWSTPNCFTGDSFNGATIVKFVNDLHKSHLAASSLEIECGYARTDGDLEFDEDRFSNISDSIATIQELGYQVALRVNPFMNIDSKAFHEALLKGFLVEDPRAEVPGLIQWKRGVAGLLDTTNHNATSWFLQRLQGLQDTTGINFFTFNNGEVSYLPVEFKTAEVLTNPCTYTQRYVELANQTQGPFFMRSVFQSQDIPVIVFTIPKAPIWGYENGLKTLIPTALTLGILGYPFIMPDLAVTGQHYNSACTESCLPDKEFLIRWLGMMAFFPAMRINVPIWEYDPGTQRIAHSLILFHQKTISHLVVSVAMETKNTGAPIIRPLWWIAPSDEIAQSIDSEFLIGNDMLVAPVLDQGETRRQVYLPEGKWKDQLHPGPSIEGGAWVEVEAMLEQVPYFTKEKE